MRNYTVEDIRKIKWKDIKDVGFQEREKLGRTIFASIAINSDYEFTKGKYDSWDVSGTADTYTYNAEIKYRYILRDKYDKVGYWLEKEKYDALMDAYKETKSIPYFITFVRNGVGYCWNLLKLEPVWKKERATASSANGTYKKGEKEKLVYHPLPREGKELKW